VAPGKGIGHWPLHNHSPLRRKNCGMTTMEEARILAHTFECAARGMKIDFKQVQPGNPEDAEAHYRSVFDKLVRDVEFIKSKARSITWKPEVVEKLKCFSVRPEAIDEWQKDGIRGHRAGCMGCTRAEECNYKAISLFGYCKPVKDDHVPFSSFDKLCNDYTVAFDAYNQVFVDAQDRRTQRHFVDGFHAQDGGMLVLGETCHNRALLYNMANNFIFNWVFIADTYVQGLQDQGRKIKDSKLYVSLEEDADGIHKSIEMLKGLAAKETAEISSTQLSVDAEWWRCVRAMRGNTAILDPSKPHFDKWTNYYEKMGRRGLSPWSAPSNKKSGLNLADALADHLKKSSSKQATYGSSDSDGASSSKDSVPTLGAPSVPVAPVAPVASAPRKRKQPEPPAQAEASLSVEGQESKHVKLRGHLLKIKDKMVSNGELADALAIMEAVLALKD
jgi:hypothetical protein